MLPTVYDKLISTVDLAGHLDDPDWLVVDCRFALTDPGKGRRDYLVSHIPGAIYAHLDDDLSGTKIPGMTGRHPLPSVEAAVDTFSGWGIDENVQVVAYDDAGGALAAVRLWWLLRWLGHENSAVLDGGWQKWLVEGRPVSVDISARPARRFNPLSHHGMIASTELVEKIRLDPEWRLLDGRAVERFRGMNETIDPVAGHIPGAISAPYLDNLNEDLTFRGREQLHEQYRRLLGEIPEEQIVVYCGSGVTSIHNILAMLQAGFSEPRLYVGSWSEWITNSSRPVATGEH